MNMKSKLRKCLAILLSASLTIPFLTGCQSNKSDSDISDDNKFTWWIYTTDAMGTYYEKYEDNPGTQWIRQQYWDTKNNTLGSEGNGEKLYFNYQAPITGAESDNFNTMIATGEYPEIIDLSVGPSARSLVQDGILMEITEYVEKYLPNYTAYLDANPELKNFVSETDENGKTHYYALYSLSDNTPMPWEGYAYRRDWIVKYAVPSEYVWDWDSDYVISNGHPLYTPISAAQDANDYTGWKKNDATSFSSTEGDNPNNDYEDNVIFPSGKTDPYTISDWEWMFEAFKKAIDQRGFDSNLNSYCISLSYLGFLQTGDLVSSFGGGNIVHYLDKNNKVQFGGYSDTFKTYLECMNNWYNKGWLDTKFETRASNQFYEINSTSCNQGMVGMWQSTMGLLGTTIRRTCENSEDKNDAMVFGCSMPINDSYGSEEQKFVEPDCLYQGSKIGLSTGFTTKCEGKNMEVLFSMINWFYSFDGALMGTFGLNEEQYESVTLEPDLYAENGLKSAYILEENADGLTEIVRTVDSSDNLVNAIKPCRMSTALSITGNPDKGYVVNNGISKITQNAIDSWLKYKATGSILDYTELLTDSESAAYNKTNNYITDYTAQAVPDMIKNGLSGWDTYVKKLQKYNPESISEILQKYIN